MASNIPTLAGPQSPTQGAKTAGGQVTTAAATTVVRPGLTKILSVTVSLDSDVADANLLVSAAIATDRKSFPLKLWKTDGVDPTPVAATSFGAKVSWLAFGY